MSLRQNLTNEDQTLASPRDDQNLQKVFKAYQIQSALDADQLDTPNPEIQKHVVLNAQELREISAEIASAVAKCAVSKVCTELAEGQGNLTNRVDSQQREILRMRQFLYAAAGALLTALIWMTWPFQSADMRGLSTNTLSSILHALVLALPTGASIGLARLRRSKKKGAKAPVDGNYSSPARFDSFIEEATSDVLESNMDQLVDRLRGSHIAETSFMDFIINH